MAIIEDQASEADIRAAYRIILNREPDEVGLRHYTRLANEGHLTPRQLQNIFLNSDELEFMRHNNARALEVDIGGVFVVVDFANLDFAESIVKHRTWEPHLVNVITESLQVGDTFVDIGANIGVMSFNAARKVGPLGKVIAFEPNQSNAQWFLKGALANKLSNIILFPLALSTHLRSSRSKDRPIVILCLRGRRLTSFNRYLETPFSAQEPRIDFIKIDIEGHEPLALRGLRDTLLKHKPWVLCEFNPICLRDHAQTEPRMFADDLFEFTSEC